MSKVTPEDFWVDIKGYEGLYQINNSGTIRSLCWGRWKTTRIRKPVKDKNGYLTVC